MAERVRQLEEKVRLYEAVLATGPVLVHVYDGDLNSRWSTAELRPEFGYRRSAPASAEENYGFLHPDDRAAARRNLGDLLQGVSIAPRRVRVRDAEGEWHWLAIVAANLLDDPDVGSVLVHAWDVSSEVQREEDVEASRRLLAALLDTLDEAVVVVSDGSIAFANARIQDLFPEIDSPQALVGRSTSDVQRAFAETMADPAAFIESAQKMVDDGEVVRNRFVETADGRILEQHYLPVSAGEHSRRMWVYRDVTAQLNFERRQQRLLQREREGRRSVEEQNDRLRELDELKTAFVATVSHELRTPLSALRSYVDLLLDPQGEALSDEQRRLAEGVKRGALRLGRLVDDLLVLAQLQTGSLPLERTIVDVSEAVADAVEDVRRVAPPDVVITKRLDSGPGTATDRLRLMQIVSNLLSNAAKFAAGEVRCTAAARDGHWVIEITDDGPGITPDELERVFEPFYRGRVGGRVRQGTGLGLPISVQLAELLDSALLVENNGSAGGVVARLTVPIATGNDDGGAA